MRNYRRLHMAGKTVFGFCEKQDSTATYIVWQAKHAFLFCSFVHVFTQLKIIFFANR